MEKLYKKLQLIRDILVKGSIGFVDPTGPLDKEEKVLKTNKYGQWTLKGDSEPGDLRDDNVPATNATDSPGVF